jgi:hypothetical protein
MRNVAYADPTSVCRRGQLGVWLRDEAVSHASHSPGMSVRTTHCSFESRQTFAARPDSDQGRVSTSLVMTRSRTSIVPLERITRRILVLRGQRVILDRELATIYGVSTKRLNEQVKRNIECRARVRQAAIGPRVAQGACSKARGARTLASGSKRKGAAAIQGGLPKPLLVVRDGQLRRGIQPLQRLIPPACSSELDRLGERH